MAAIAVGMETGMDAGGDVSANAHNYGIQRMIQAEATPITWMALTSEWMHDWSNLQADSWLKELG